MKLLTRVQTFDGVLHNDRDAATRHLDRLYGAALSKLAHKIIAESDFKYSHLVEFLDGNLDSFKELMNIKADLVLEDARDE
jgi:hypothetical protein